MDDMTQGRSGHHRCEQDREPVRRTLQMIESGAADRFQNDPENKRSFHNPKWDKALKCRHKTQDTRELFTRVKRLSQRHLICRTRRYRHSHGRKNQNNKRYER